MNADLLNSLNSFLNFQVLLDILAIKNDVHFWKTRESFAGLSKKTVMWRAFSQIVICLFLVEENSSALVTVPAFAGVLIEVSFSQWSITNICVCGGRIFSSGGFLFLHVISLISALESPEGGRLRLEKVCKERSSHVQSRIDD